MNIKVLDCTLRDGGYVNSWNFGQTTAKKIIKNLLNAGIDYIEVGFLQNCTFDTEKTLFNDIKEAVNLVIKNNKTKYTVMFVYGRFNYNKLVPKTPDILIDAIRVTFKKHETEEVFKCLYKIKELGYELFVNPTNIESYSDIELLKLIEKVNKLNPNVFSIVDTNGVLKKKDIHRLFYLIDNNLNKGITIAFHSHNNLQLSFSNSQILFEDNISRNLIIDSTVFGMGRGAGNLCTELLTQYLNENNNSHYDIIPILKIVDEQINPIFMNTPWGYSVPYYLASINNCHPNYANYLVDKQTVTIEMVNKILKAIPDVKKPTYDKDIIKQIYLDMLSNNIDDSVVLDKLKNILLQRNILVLAPGKSIIEEKEKIDLFIQEKKPFIISLNFIPDNYKTDLVFITNMKRFSSLENNTHKMIISSNIKDIPADAMVINYSSYLNNSSAFDNVALMLFNMLVKIGIKIIYISGLDGYSQKQTDNYTTETLISSTKSYEFEEKNRVMIEQIKKFSKAINIIFITKSKYFQDNKEVL